MSRKYWLVALPVVLLLGFSGRNLIVPVITRGADRRIVSEEFTKFEGRIGHHLYAPTWLPKGGRPDDDGPTQGAKRILTDYSDDDDRILLILAQERRTEDRDRYHGRVFTARAEAQAQINDATGYFITGSNGERRLFWNEPDMALIMSSSTLSDDELLKIARAVE